MGFSSEQCGKLLVENGYWAYYAFDTARNMLLHQKPRNINILTNADLGDLSKLFPDIIFSGDGYGQARLKNDGYSVQFYISDLDADRMVYIPGLAEPEKEALKKATSLTPFSINCFFYDIRKDIFYDPLDAYELLRKGVINTNIPPRQAVKGFSTLALKTALLFSETGFEVDPVLDQLLEGMSFVSGYRKITKSMSSDLNRILTSGRAYESLVLLNRWGVLDALLPEVTTLKKVNQDKDHHPEGNGFWHTMRCLRCVKKPNKNLMMAALLHDTGKATTFSRRKKHRLVFPDHSKVSREIAARVLKRFHYSSGDIQEILFLVENHMILGAVDRLPEKRQNMVFMSPYFPNLLELYRADIESGYHHAGNYYHVSRLYREYLRKQKLREQGIYV
ncbi:MAG: HD domain-containing protein [Spirochaetota bacterium]